MAVDLAFERDLEYERDAEADEAGADVWWARCLDPACDYEFETVNQTHPPCPNCGGEAEVV